MVLAPPQAAYRKVCREKSFRKGRIEKIYNGNDLLFWHKSSDSGREVNIIEADSLPNKYYFCAQFNAEWSLYPASNWPFRRF